MKVTKTFFTLIESFALSMLTVNAKNGGMSMESRAKRMYKTFMDSNKDAHREFIINSYNKKFIEI